VSGNHLSIRLASRGVYKLCIAPRAVYPTSDIEFSVSTGVLLRVINASPPPPPPPVETVNRSESPLQLVATLLGSLASVIAVGGAMIGACRYYRKRRTSGSAGQSEQARVEIGLRGEQPMNKVLLTSTSPRSDAAPISTAHTCTCTCTGTELTGC